MAETRKETSRHPYLKHTISPQLQFKHLTGMGVILLPLICTTESSVNKHLALKYHQTLLYYSKTTKRYLQNQTRKSKKMLGNDPGQSSLSSSTTSSSLSSLTTISRSN